MLTTDKRGQAQQIARVREFKPLTHDRAMQQALDRARAAQPPMSPLAGKAGMPWNSSHDK